MPEDSQKEENLFTIGFYNLENLFDTFNDPSTLDDDFTASSAKKWTEKRFRKKVKKLGRVISNIGYEDIGYVPVLLGVAEVENARVLEALVNSKFLKKKGFDFVHFESPDERGIDTALLFRTEYFSIINTEAHPLYLINETGDRDYTRDILHVHGELEGQSVHVLVNHWPSRRSGTEETEHKRIKAAQKNIEILDGILNDHPEARVLIMGDFNDDPHSNSIQHLISGGLYNPMETLFSKYSGSLSYKRNWHLFDQIVMSHNFLKGHDNEFRFKKAKVYNPREVQEFKGKYKGSPFRTYVGKKYKGGYSDHFPVYAIFEIKS